MLNIRNFVIFAHVDHGKSTLADRFLELTSTISKDKMKPQYLDMMELEREKGITIKMQPVRMLYKGHILNLIDTPGHVDFSYEVSRALAAVEGAILLVDATKGIQAQTLANLELAKKQNLVIIPAINKIDSPQARTDETRKELARLLNISEENIFLISAKEGTNVQDLLEEVIKKVPYPNISEFEDLIKKPLRALIFDSDYDSFKGVIAYIKVVEGEISSNQKIYLMQAGVEGDAKEIGCFNPEPKPVAGLKAGEIGYLATGIKEHNKVRVGDTITVQFSDSSFRALKSMAPLPGYKESKPMIFASIYPENPDEFELLKTALSKLKLSDASLFFEPESKEALGRGFRCGFLGSLHAEIISERLRREFGLDLIISTPSVIYKIVNKKDQDVFIYSASDWPVSSEIKEIQEPWMKLEIMTPTNYLGRVSDLLKNLTGNYLETKYFSFDKLLLIYEFPLREIISGFYDRLKGVSQGFASMNYEALGYRKGDLIKIEILIAGRSEEFFARIIPRKNAFKEAQKQLLKLKEVLPPQLFMVSLQAVTEGKILCRENIRAKGRDVIAPLYGGDYTRKRKLLERQKKGKKELKAKGRVIIPPKVFLEIFKG